MRVLIETRTNALKLTESKQIKKGCLGRLEGVCADFKNPTRNGRLYPLDLWKKVFNDELFKESLQNKTLFGELDHPEDRFEPLITEACVVMTDYKIDEDKGLIYGGFDILDTPSGRILKSILDYGSVVGVSSRGQGDIVETANGEQVDENSYEFACFDVVSTPAVAKARQNVMESIKRVTTQTFDESIRQQIKDAETVSDLNIIRSVVRTSDLNSSEIDSLIESIEDRCKSLQKKAEDTILASEKKVTETTDTETQNVGGSAKTIRENKKLYRCISDLRKQLAAYKHRESRYVETISQKNDELQSLNSQLTREQGRRKVSETKVHKVTENTDRQLSNSRKMISDLRRNESSLREQIQSCEEQISNLQEDKLSYTRQIESLKKAEDSRISRLKQDLKDKDNKITSLQEQLRTHSEKLCTLRDVERDLDECSRQLEESQLRQQHIESLLEESRATNTDLLQELDKTKTTSKKLAERLKQFQARYVDHIAKSNGLSASMITESVTLSTTPQQVDSIVKTVRENLDNRNKFGVSSETISSRDGLIVESISKADRQVESDDVETERLDNFLTLAASGNAIK